MNQYQLLIGPDLQEVDVDERIGIAFSKQYEDLDNPTKIYATWSKTIQLPMTANNNKIFDKLYRPDQIVTTADIDPRKKVPFVLLHNQEHIVTGYAKILKIDNSQKNKKYQITLYSVLGEVLNDLKLMTFNASQAKESDPEHPTKYLLRNPLTSNTVINRNIVKDSWEQSVHVIDINNKGNLDYIGFIPTYQGCYPDFDSKSLEVLPGRVDPYWGDDDAGKKIDREVDEHYLGDFRSYYQQPFVWVDALIQLLKEKIEQETEYKINLDKSWFNNQNPYWTKAILTCPTLYNPQDDTAQMPKENFDYQWPLAVSNTTQQSDLSNNHKQILPFTHKSGTYIMDTYGNHKFRAPGGGKAVFKMSMIYWLFAVKTDPQLADGYAKLRDDNNLFLEFRAVDAQTNEYIPGAKFTYMFHSGDTDHTTGYDKDIDVGVASRNNPDYVTSPDSNIVRKDTGYCWSGELNVTLNINWNRPYYIIMNQYARNNGDPFEFAIGSWIPQWDWLWKDFYQDYDTGGVSGIRGHYWYITCVSASVEEGSDLRSNSKLTMDRIWSFDKTPFEYIMNYCKMFRLVFDLNEDTKEVTIMSRNRYFQNYEIVDWSRKLDRTKDFSVEPINFDKKYFNFKYKEGEGQRHKYYQDKYKANYGSYKVDTGYDFNIDSTDIFEELMPSMVTTKKQADCMHNTMFPGRSGFMGYNWKYLPRELYVENDDDGSNAGNAGAFYFKVGRYLCDSNMRHKNRNGQGFNWISDDSDHQIVTNNYCWHIIPEYLALTAWLPLITTEIKDWSNNQYSFQFQQPKEIYYNQNVYTVNNPKYIYDNFWKKYMDERYSVQTKVVTAYFYLLSQDFLEFKFNKFVMVDNVLYMVNKIYDFNLTTDKTTKVQLVQVNDIEGYTKSCPTFPYLNTDRMIVNVTSDNISNVEVFSSSNWWVSYASPWLWASKDGNMLQMRGYDINYGNDKNGYVELENNDGCFYLVFVTLQHTESYLYYNPNSLSFSRTSCSQAVNMDSQPETVTVVSKPKWCDTEIRTERYIAWGERVNTYTKGNDRISREGSIKLYVSVAPNASRFTRSGNIVVTNGYDTITIPVSQQGFPRIVPDEPVVPVGPITPGDDPVYPVIVRRDLVAGEATPLTLYTNKEVKLNSARISSGIVSVAGANKIDEVNFYAQPEMSEQHVLEGKTADGGVITMETVDGELIKFNYNIGDKTTRYSVCIQSLDWEQGSVTVDGTTANYYADDEEGTIHTVTCTAEAGWIFDSWSDGDANASRTITVNSDICIYPLFHEDRPLNTYTVTNTLTNVVTTNSQATALEESEYRATLEAYRWFTMQSINITMGGTDITTTVYHNGSIVIPHVTGNITITATAGYGDWDYVWSCQEANGPIDPYTHNTDAGAFIGTRSETWGENPWVHDNIGFNLPTHSGSTLEYEIECGFVPLPNLTDFPGSPSIQINGGFVVYFDQRRKKVFTDLNSTSHNYQDTQQTILTGKEPQLLRIFKDGSKAEVKYGSTLSIAGVMPSEVENDIIQPYYFDGTPRGSIMYIYTIRYKVKQLPGLKTVKVNAFNPAGGTVSVNGVVGNFNQQLREGDQIQIKANPNTGYRFRWWLPDYNPNQIRTYIVNSNATQTIRAEFEHLEPENNEIWYVSTDGNIVTPTVPTSIKDANDNNLNIVSNVYHNGRGIMTFDGDVAQIKGYGPVGAFRGCSTLGEITVPSTVTYLSGFYSCRNLTNIKGIENVVEIGDAAFAMTAIESFEIPDSVTTVGGSIFMDCDKLIKVRWGKNVSTCGTGIFTNCDALVDFDSNEGAIQLGSLFSNCTSLKSYKFTGDEYGSAAGTFTGCTSLVDIDFTNARFTTIDYHPYGFIRYTKVTSIKLPDTLERIDGVGNLGANDYLNNVILGPNVQYIDDRTFAANPNLKYIYCYAQTAPTLGPDVFLNSSISGELHIPNGADYSSWVSELPNGGQDWTVIDDL